MTRLRVVIADDQPMMRAGFKAVLEATGNIEVVAEAGTGEEAVAAARRPNGLLPVARLGHHDDVARRLEHGLEPGAHHRLVVGDDDAQRAHAPPSL